MDRRKKIHIDDYKHLKQYFTLRHSGCCESMIFDTYLWNPYYKLDYVELENGLFWIYMDEKHCYSVTPLCKTEHMKHVAGQMQQYFNEVLHRPLEMYAVDKEALEAMELDESRYEIHLSRDHFDYVYDANKLATLSGKKYHKKKNHVNAFLKAYEGRWEYRTLTYENKDEILEFLAKWKENRTQEDSQETVDYEAEGIRYILEECQLLEYRMGGIYIDGRLEAFSMGSYDSTMKMAYIHVEKANQNIRGAYPVINQQFAKHAFPEAQWINREDDMGLEGLRKAKESYHPVYLAEKYYVKQKEL